MTPWRDSPFRNLIAGLIYMAVVAGLATLAYVDLGWSWDDAFYFVVYTIFTVGYDELHPIVTPELRFVTISTIVLGCTGVIYLTGALVQFFTYMQLQQLLGSRRMKSKINTLTGHVIVCGFGRIGHMLADELKAGGIDFVILDRDEAKLAEASERGHLTWSGDATDEAVLETVGVHKARALACVVPNDAVNVFITLSARNLNKDIEIIARGEAASTKSKLLRAGANSVVEPTHIGAERIAQLILFPQTSKLTDSSRMRTLAAGLHGLGLELEVTAAAPDGPMAGATIEAVERAAGGTMFVVALNRKGGETVSRPDPQTVIEGGDGVVSITRTGRSAPRKN
jgi:voltage-gated potassium channel Kch